MAFRCMVYDADATMAYDPDATRVYDPDATMVYDPGRKHAWPPGLGYCLRSRVLVLLGLVLAPFCRVGRRLTQDPRNRRLALVQQYSVQ